MYATQIRKPGAATWGGGYSAYPCGPWWEVDGLSVTQSDSGKKSRLVLTIDPFAKKTIGSGQVRFVDHDGIDYLGSYVVNEDGTAALTLLGTAPVFGQVNTVGTKYLNIYLERPRPPLPLTEWRYKSRPIPPAPKN